MIPRRRQSSSNPLAILFQSHPADPTPMPIPPCRSHADPPHADPARQYTPINANPTSTPAVPPCMHASSRTLRKPIANPARQYTPIYADRHPDRRYTPISYADPRILEHLLPASSPHPRPPRTPPPRIPRILLPVPSRCDMMGRTR
jgi:hypothetical protein